MGTVNVSNGDIIRVRRFGVDHEFQVEFSGDDKTGEINFVRPVYMCRACEENQVDEPDNMPYCPRCLMDAQLFAVLRRIVDNVGDENVPVARVLEWDEENMRGARIRGEQYIDIESSAMDWIAAMSPDEFRDEFASYIARSLPSYMRDAVASKLT